MSFCMGLFRYIGVLDDYARCRLCGVDLKVSCCGFATFQEDVRGEKQMLQDSAFRCVHQMHLFTEDGVARTAWPFERRLRLVEGRLVPLRESMPVVSVAQAMEIE